MSLLSPCGLPRLLLALKLLLHFAGIDDLVGRVWRVVRPHSLPGGPVALYLMGEYPGTYVGGHTGVTEVADADAVLFEGRVPPVIDLHQANVLGPVRIAANCIGVQSTFNRGDSQQQIEIDPVMGSRLFETLNRP